jgi:myosin heavy subunit
MIYLVFISVAVLLMAGVWVIYKGYRSSEENDRAVPISDPAELNALKPVFVANQNVKSAPVRVFGDEEHLQELQTKIEKLSHEKEDLRVALEKEIALHSAQSLTEEERRKWRETADQLKTLQANVENFREESNKAQNEMNQMRARLIAAQQQNQALRQERLNLQETERRLQKIRQDYDQLKESAKTQYQMRDRLSDEQTKQNQAWEEKEKRYEDKISELKQMLLEWERMGQERQALWESVKSDLQTQNANLLKRLQEQEKNMTVLQTEIKDIETKKDSTESGSTGTLTANDEQRWKERVRQLEDFNAFLLAKERKLQYELTKNRAQTLGLERMFEDLKRQIELAQRQ